MPSGVTDAPWQPDTVCFQIDEQIRKSANIAITTHYGMDGDAVGSCVALREVLRDAGKRVIMINCTPTPYNYKFIAPDGSFETELPPDFAPDLFIVLDAATPGRIRRENPLPTGVPIVNIDHHIGNSLFGAYNWIEPKSPCVGVMLLDFFIHFGYSMNSLALDALFVSLITDTGRFSFSNTDTRAFAAAMQLVSHGVSPSKIASEVYFSKSTGKLKLIALAYSRLEFACDGKIAFVSFTQKEMESFGLTEYETHEVVDIPRSAASAELALYFLEKTDGVTKASVRSKTVFDCRTFAEEFGGGGHNRAAGIRLQLPLDEARRAILDRACEILCGKTCCGRLK